MQLFCKKFAQHSNNLLQFSFLLTQASAMPTFQTLSVTPELRPVQREVSARRKVSDARAGTVSFASSCGSPPKQLGIAWLCDTAPLFREEAFGVSLPRWNDCPYRNPNHPLHPTKAISFKEFNSGIRKLKDIHFLLDKNYNSYSSSTSETSRLLGPFLSFFLTTRNVVLFDLWR